MKRSGSVILFNQRALERAAEVDGEPMYGFLAPRIAREKLPEGELYALHLLKLDALLDQALETDGAALARIDALHDGARAEALAAFAEDGPLGRLGFSLLAHPEAQSRTAFVVRVPERLPAAALVRRLESEHGIVVSPALHPQANTKNHNVIRFGVYSAARIEEVRALLAALEAEGSAGPA
jgi:aspartate aminotransferase-like enzyme